MLTLFSTAKPFLGHSRVIQRNALQSWKLLHPDAEVILFGNDEGAAETCRDLGLRHEPYVKRNENGTKYLNWIFDKANEYSRHQFLCYANCDIMLGPDFLAALQVVSARHNRFLITGRRWDTNITAPWDFTRPDSGAQLRSLALQKGKQNGPTWLDYFCFTRDLYYRKMPPFLIGRQGWDPWLSYFCRKSHAALVDATRAVAAVHQNHDYAYMKTGGASRYSEAEAEYNWRLGDTSWWHFYCLHSATDELVDGRLRRKWLAPLGATRTRMIAFGQQAKFACLKATRPVRHPLGLRRKTS